MERTTFNANSRIITVETVGDTRYFSYLYVYKEGGSS
jgi:hypothetical protein